ncbi:MAG: hypothetical protein WC571_06100 [Candidatus Omnitrophota bacterium]
MRKNIYLALVTLILAQGFNTAPYAYADRGRGGDDGHHRSYYKNYRYYPSDYYNYRKIYYYPKKRYYHYYDVLPAKIYYYQYEKEFAYSNPSYLPITSVANMCSQGIPEDVIIEEIQRTGSVYKLSSETITYLRQNGASDRLINFMLEERVKAY